MRRFRDVALSLRRFVQVLMATHDYGTATDITYSTRQVKLAAA